MVQVEEGKEYHYCRCGLSKNQPWCDGSHAKEPTGITPLAFKAEATEQKAFCMCRKSKNQPFCDGSHRHLAAAAAGGSEPKYPKVADNKPKMVQVEEGKEYHYCRCGLSKNQPWCDGSHAKEPTGITPLAFKAEATEQKAFCMCRKSKNQPFCDGSHRHLPAVTDIEDLVGGAKGGGGGDFAELMNAGPTKEEPTLGAVKALARGDTQKMGHHGEMGAMGVPLVDLPRWDDLQLVVAQLATKPLMDDAPVDTSVVLGPRAKKPLKFAVPIIISDMSFGALSEEAKTCLARGAEMAGTGICSGEGGMLPEEQQANSRYLYELASAKFGFHLENMRKVQAFHFKGGQGAKTGTGGHLPGNKVVGKIAQVRELKEGQSAVSPPTFSDLKTPADFKALADQVREVSGGIPIGFKISAQHIEKDIAFAVEASADYIIIDGRGGGTGAAPLIFRDNISVPTIPAVARARRCLDAMGDKGRGVTLVATGGLRLPADFVKALCLGADMVAVSNSAIQSIGCVAARMCNTNLCPAGIATQDKDLRQKLDVTKGAEQLKNFLSGSAGLMSVLARACGHARLADFCLDDLTTWKKDMADMTGVSYGGVADPFRRIKELEAELARLKPAASNKDDGPLCPGDNY